ncbi:MAG: hypothetical protein ACKVOT_08245 [Polaromonas sp.]
MQARRTFTVCTLSLAALVANAHDTWFEAPKASNARLELRLGTGNRYPVHQTGIGAEYLERQGCRGPQSTDPEQHMAPARNDEHALVLRLPRRAVTCWAQLVPLDIELTPEMVAVYLREVQAPAEVRGQWSKMQAQGLPWKERYIKHARIDERVATGHSPGPAPMAMDIVRSAATTLGWQFQVLKDGAPLVGQAMELISESATHGLWRLTDAQGRVAWPSLPTGRWLLRGTHLRPSDEDPTRWDSGFVTLAFEVPPVAVSAIRPGVR